MIVDYIISKECKNEEVLYSLCVSLVDYIISKECKNEEVWCTCYKCGKCGRVFENGYLIDDGGTTIEEEEE